MGRLLIRRDSEQDALNLLQDETIELTGRRDGGELTKEPDSASKMILESVRVDKRAQIRSAPCRGEDKHVAELSARLLVKAFCFNQCIASKTYA